MDNTAVYSECVCKWEDMMSSVFTFDVENYLCLSEIWLLCTEKGKLKDQERKREVSLREVVSTF